MRGDDPQQAAMFSYISPEERVPLEHPLRAIRTLVDDVLKELSPSLTSCTRTPGGRRSLLRSCCVRSCCKCSTRCAASGC